MQSVVITGASTGIGWVTAKLLLDRGFRVFGGVRKPADADRLSSEFGANFTPLLFDVADEAAVLAAAREVRAARRGAGAGARGRRISPPDGCERHRVNHRHASVRSVARVRSVAEGKAGADRDDQLGGRQEWQPADVGLFSLEARDRGIVGKPAPGNDAVRYRCHHHCAGRGEDADLEQGRGNRHFRLQELPVLPGAGKNPQIHAALR